MKDDYKHWCGCITSKKDGAIYFVRICDLPKHKWGNIWIISQHPKTNEVKK